ncbi:hypothetical protein [Aliterella atlantica]|uniref:hypothetical protein n=1 Tax=Aliterella atlantica TaxID=1827278 RepID=UPI00118584E6|nr:hypothetical protein [Aliterella atlantica]
MGLSQVNGRNKAITTKHRVPVLNRSIKICPNLLTTSTGHSQKYQFLTNYDTFKGKESAKVLRIALWFGIQAEEITKYRNSLPKP